MKLTLSPVLYDWPRDRLLGFYAEAAAIAVDTVYIGEVVCRKRRGLTIDDIREAALGLKEAGKEVYLSTLAVVATEEELGFIREIVKLAKEIDCGVEANDSAAIAIASREGVPLAAGPHILTYNSDDALFLRSCGVARVTFPVELPRESVEHIVSETGIYGEQISFGRVPLAFSWRCYSSRANGRKSSECRSDCRSHPEGLAIRSIDGEELFTINGTSILSGAIYSLAGFVEGLRDSGLSALRILPQANGTAEIVDIFRARIDGKLSIEEGQKEIALLTGNAEICNGWYSGKAGKDLTGPETLTSFEDELFTDTPRNNIIELP